MAAHGPCLMKTRSYTIIPLATCTLFMTMYVRTFDPQEKQILRLQENYALWDLPIEIGAMFKAIEGRRN